MKRKYVVRPGTHLSIGKAWQSTLEANGLVDFQDFWTLERSWIDKPNRFGNGWSGVSRHELESPDGERMGVYVKRQQDYCRQYLGPSLPSPLMMRREVRNILRFGVKDCPALELVAWGTCRDQGARRGVMMTVALDGYVSLQELVERWDSEGWPNREERLLWIDAIASFVRTMHEGGLRHNMLYPKHIFVREELLAIPPDQWGSSREGAIRVIDLESASTSWIRPRATYLDLERLNRYSPRWSRSEKLRFYKVYLGRERLNFIDRGMLKLILWRAMRMAKRRGRTPN